MKKPFTFTISSRNVDELQLYLRACEFISPDRICTELTLEEIIQVVKAIHHAYDEKVRNSSLGLGPDVNLEHLETPKALFLELSGMTGEIIKETLGFRYSLSKRMKNRLSDDALQPGSELFQAEFVFSPR
jgi:hypothetical protein